jgi:hypothetical protein
MNSAPAAMGPLESPHPRTRPPRSGARSLWPKEHGAYGQLAMPLVAALASARPSVASWFLVLGAAAAFVAHEPLLVLLGFRGTRARREDGPRAARIGLSFLSGALLFGLTGLVVGGLDVLLASLVPLALVVVLLPFVLRGAEKSTGGELVASSALSAAAVPVAVSAGLSLGAAALAWSVWVLAFSASTAGVRWVISKDRSTIDARALPSIVVASTIGLVALGSLAPGLAVAGLPMLGLSWWLVARPPARGALRRVGWTLMGASVTTAIVIVLATRLSG